MTPAAAMHGRVMQWFCVIGECVAADVDTMIPMANGRTNPAVSLSTIISLLFFANVAIIFTNFAKMCPKFNENRERFLKIYN